MANHQNHRNYSRNLQTLSCVFICIRKSKKRAHKSVGPANAMNQMGQEYWMAKTQVFVVGYKSSKQRGLFSFIRNERGKFCLSTPQLQKNLETFLKRHLLLQLCLQQALHMTRVNQKVSLQGSIFPYSSVLLCYRDIE